MSDNDKYLKFAKELALEAGGLMKRYFRSEEIGTTWKEDATPLTVADTTINKLVIEQVKAKFPDHGVLGEEESYEPERDFIWVVDPIDGTVPFSLGMPLSTFSLALVDRHDGRPIVGVLYEPWLDELFYASAGGGSFVNGKPLKTSTATNFGQNYFAISIGNFELVKKVRAEGGKLMYIASFCYFSARVAAGQLLAAVPINPEIWDVAASALIVSEAGGVVTDQHGNPVRCDEKVNGVIMAANKEIHAKLLKLMNGPT